MNIKNCTVLVTGGASGLGEACVRKFLADGAKIAILDFDQERGEKISEELGSDVIFCKTDVTDMAGVQAAVDKSVNAFGAIHVLINCAGVGTPSKVLSKRGPIDMAGFSRTVGINLIGTMNVIVAAAEKMTANEGNADGEKGVVINTASAAAFDGQIGQAAYSASKAGGVGMTLPIAREFGDYGIRVMTIAPGLFETPLMATLPEEVRAALAKLPPFPKRLGKPEEYAMLAGQIIENPILNGETIRLDSCIRMTAR